MIQKNIYITTLVITSSLITSSLTTLILPKAHSSESWQTQNKQIESYLRQNNYKKVLEAYKTLFNTLSKDKNSTQHTYLNNVLLSDIPKAVENMSKNRYFKDAEDLALLKLNTAEKLFGKDSVYTIDSYQDLITIYSAKKDNTLMAKTIVQYSNLCAEMKNKGKQAEIDQGLKFRTNRIRKKLREETELSKQFTPVK